MSIPKDDDLIFDKDALDKMMFSFKDLHLKSGTFVCVDNNHDKLAKYYIEQTWFHSEDNISYMISETRTKI